jgi:predicted membrane protein
MSRSHIRRSQSGSSRLKAIVWTAILAAFVYVCIRVVPLYVNDFQFRDAMESAARFASVNRQSPDEIRKKLLQEAEMAEMPIRLEDIKVVNRGGRVDIEASYSITVDLHIYQWTINFHPTASNSRL